MRGWLWSYCPGSKQTYTVSRDGSFLLTGRCLYGPGVWESQILPVNWAIPALDDHFIHILGQFFGTNLPVFLGCTEDCIHHPPSAVPSLWKDKAWPCWVRAGWLYLCSHQISGRCVLWSSHLGQLPGCQASVGIIIKQQQLIFASYHGDVTVLDAVEEKHRAVQELKNSRFWDLPGGPVVKTPRFLCKGCGFDPWSGNEGSTCHVVQPKKKEEKTML